MLIRLKVSGFKNLADVDVRFGPFTCIAGPNGVGKSNLFDAILFLAALTDQTLVEAAAGVRAEAGRPGDPRSTFSRFSAVRPEFRPMEFEADLILPQTGLDELGGAVEASTTLVRYRLRLGWRGADSSHRGEAGPLELLEESLVPLPRGNAVDANMFPHSAALRRSIVHGRRTRDFISTESRPDGTLVRLHQDGRSGRLFSRQASSLPRTLLSTVNVGEFPTAMLVRREMQSWRRLHLESSALRRPDPFNAPIRMSAMGEHLPAAVYHLSGGSREPGGGGGPVENAHIANRLSELIEDVRAIQVVPDPAKESYTLYLQTLDGAEYPASALSDGTLRFLALAVTEYDQRGGGLLCFEEPENGIHPGRVHAMLRLLRDIAVDPDEAAGGTNPLRQVIINTHSPGVVQQVPDDALLLAETVEMPVASDGDPLREASAPGRRCRVLQLSCLNDTWRSRMDPRPPITSRGSLMAYLNPTLAAPDAGDGTRRVLDRSDLQMLLPIGPA